MAIVRKKTKNLLDGSKYFESLFLIKYLLSMKRIKGVLKLDGVNFYFFSEKTGRIKETIGYVKYVNKTDTNIDVGFIDYYPVNDFLLEKIYSENTICYIEQDSKGFKFHDDKLILLV